MSGIDQEIWQDFVVEAEENMQELEPNLLLLEQDPENTSLLNDCFRNMHSIKGAANYMGLERTATLAHRMESLFDNVRQGNIALDEHAMNTLFDGLDKVKQLVREISESHEEKSEIDDIVQELEAIISGKGPDPDSNTGESRSTSHVDSEEETAEEMDDDAELLAIFTEELRSRMEQLEKLSPPVEKEVVKEILEDMIRVTNYIGIEELLNGLEREAAIFMEETTDSNSLLTEEEIDSVVTQLRTLFATHLSSDFANREPDSNENITLAGEEDEELYRIFLEFVQEEGRPLANIPEQPDSAWLESCRQAVERLTASAHYMDYHDVVSLLEEWDERLVEALSCVTEERPFNGEPLRRLWARFCAMLPGLESCLTPMEEVPAQKDQAVEDNRSETVTHDTAQAPVHDGSLSGSEPDTDTGMTTGTTDQDDSFKGLDSALDSMFEGALPDEPDSAPITGINAGTDEKIVSESISPDQDHQNANPEKIPASSPPELTQSSDISGASFTSLQGQGQTVDTQGEVIPGRPELQDKPANTKLVRVDLTKVEALLEDVGELVVLRAAMLQIADDMKELYSRWIDERRVTSSELKPFKHIMIRTAEQTATLEKVVHQLQDGVMKMRMLPVGTLFRRYPRMIRDLSHKLNKKVELRIYGEGTALDKRVIEHITDPLQHIIRNAVDHGIEAPDVRKRLGKPDAGVITLSAGQEGNFVILTISDDGRGLDREAIIQKAISNGVISGDTARTMSDERVWNMIFLPGISTASTVSETSGRGVGMDVVKNNIERLGGQITINSSPGRGTSITLRIPLTLAIIQTLLVQVGEQNMAIPLSAVQETFRIYEQDVSSIEGFEIISLRQETLPLIRLGSIFRGTGAEENPSKLFVVRVKMQDMEAGLAVDRFIGQQEVVIKPLADYLTDEPGFSGATILGDGTVALILDIPAVLERARNFTLKRQQIMEQAALGLNAGETSLVFH